MIAAAFARVNPPQCQYYACAVQCDIGERGITPGYVQLMPLVDYAEGYTCYKCAGERGPVLHVPGIEGVIPEPGQNAEKWYVQQVLQGRGSPADEPVDAGLLRINIARY